MFRGKGPGSIGFFKINELINFYTLPFWVFVLALLVWVIVTCLPSDLVVVVVVVVTGFISKSSTLNSSLILG